MTRSLRAAAGSGAPPGFLGRHRALDPLIAPRPRRARSLVEAGRPPGQEGVEPLGEVPPVSDAGQALELLVEVIVQAVDSRGLVEKALGDAVRAGRALGELCWRGPHLLLEALRRVD